MSKKTYSDEKRKIWKDPYLISPAFLHLGVQTKSVINNKYIDILQFMIAPILIGSGINSLNLKEISNLNKAIRPKHNFNELENEIIVNLFLNS